MKNLNSDLLVSIADYLGLKSLSNFFTAVKMNARRTYTITCRDCGGKFINKLGLKRKFSYKMLLKSNYKCRGRIRKWMHNVTQRMMNGRSFVIRYNER